MNETEFAAFILKQVKEQGPIQVFYSKWIEGRQLEDTVSLLAEGIRVLKITTHEALTLAIFIGLTTEVKKEESK